jgi:hypothetical protein
MKREEVYALIDGERAYQDSFVTERFRHSEADRSVSSELLMLEEYVARARKAWVDNKGDQAALAVIRKVAGIAVRCMENHGAPMRVE